MKTFVTILVSVLFIACIFCCDSIILKHPSEPELNVNTENLNFSVSGGTETLDIHSNTDWEIIVPEDSLWIQSVKPSSGRGNALVTVSVSPNSLYNDRNASLTLSSHKPSPISPITVSVNQPQFVPELNVNTDSLSFSVSGGTVTLDIVSNIAWVITVPGNSTWIQSVAPLSGTGNASVTVSVASNSTFVERNASFTLASLETSPISPITVSVNQPQFVPELNVNTKNLAFPVSGGTKTFTITSNIPWKITVPNNASWIQSVAPLSGTGNATVTVSIASNSTFSDRNASLTLASLESSPISPITVSVSQTQLVPQLSANPNNLTYTVSGGTKTFTINSNTSWTLSIPDSASWIQSVTPASGTGNTSVTVSVASNSTFLDRNASLTLASLETTPATVTVSQSRLVPQLSASVSSLSFPAKGDTKTFTITSNTPWTLTVPGTATWIQSVSPASGTGNATITVSVKGNYSSGGRSASLTLASPNTTSTTITVSQPDVADPIAFTSFTAQRLENYYLLPSNNVNFYWLRTIGFGIASNIVSQMEINTTLPSSFITNLNGTTTKSANFVLTILTNGNVTTNNYTIDFTNKASLSTLQSLEYTLQNTASSTTLSFPKTSSYSLNYTPTKSYSFAFPIEIGYNPGFGYSIYPYEPYTETSGGVTYYYSVTSTVAYNGPCTAVSRNFYQYQSMTLNYPNDVFITQVIPYPIVKNFTVTDHSLIINLNDYNEVYSGSVAQLFLTGSDGVSYRRDITIQ